MTTTTTQKIYSEAAAREILARKDALMADAIARIEAGLVADVVDLIPSEAEMLAWSAAAKAVLVYEAAAAHNFDAAWVDAALKDALTGYNAGTGEDLYRKGIHGLDGRIKRELKAQKIAAALEETKAQAQRLGKKVCNRCGGRGEYSFNLMYGSTCFGCGGKGYK
jgi:hypothetical protein